MRSGLGLLSQSAAKKEKVSNNWETDGLFSDLKLTNTDAKRATATQRIEVVAGVECSVNATLIEGAGSIHCGTTPPYRDLLTTNALAPGQSVNRKIKPQTDEIWIRLVTESRLVGASSSWKISVK